MERKLVGILGFVVLFSICIVPMSVLADSWPMFHHDLTHSGYSTSTAPKTNATLWTYTTGGPRWLTSAAVVDGKVYVASDDGFTYCFNASTGAKIWTSWPGSYSSSPTVVDGKVYIGSYGAYYGDGRVYCLNASTAAVIWNSATGVGIGHSSPAVVDGKVYIGSLDHRVYCFNASTGAKIWNYTTGHWVDSSPAVANGKVYIGSYDCRVYCLDASTGAQIWNYYTGEYNNIEDSSPAVVDGKVYIGSQEGRVYCFNASTGAVIWNYLTPKPPLGYGLHISTPAVVDGKVYVGAGEYGEVFILYCFNASTGAVIWSYTTGTPWGGTPIQVSSPAVADGKVYVGSCASDGRVFCFNASTGAQIWTYTTGAFVTASPAVANGIVYVGSWNQKFYAFGSPQYQMAVNAVGSGSVAKIPDQTSYDWGTNVTLTATPTLGWSFDHWSGDASGTLNPITINMTSDKAVTATFTQNSYKIDVSVNGHGHVDRNASELYVYGQAVNLTAVPDAGWSFSAWSQDLSGSANPATLIMTGNWTVTATFTQNVYALTVTAVGSGSVNLNNTGPYHYGDVVQLTAVPATGWSFDHWGGDLSGSTNPKTILIDGDKTVTATFTQNVYTLTVSTVGNGNVNLNNSGPYHYGDIVQLTAVPATGWSFSLWSGHLSGSANPAAIVIDGNKAVTATFSQNTYTLTVTTAGSGSVNLNNSGPYHYGDVVQLTAVPTVGWSFQSWGGDLSGSVNPATIVIDGNKVVTAAFTQNVYTLTVSTVGSGNVNLNNSGPYHYGDVVQLTAVPTVGWSFSAWSGHLSGSANPATVIIDGNKVVTATFTQNVERVEVYVKGKLAVIESNVTLTKAVVTSNTLHFNATGTTGNAGWINVTFPMVNTTDIKVFIDGHKLTPPPFPIISSNSTYYFVYFEFTLSTHAIMIQFALESAPVGGEWAPISTVQLTPWIVYALLTIASAAALSYRLLRKRL